MQHHDRGKGPIPLGGERHVDIEWDPVEARDAAGVAGRGAEAHAVLRDAGVSERIGRGGLGGTGGRERAESQADCEQGPQRQDCLLGEALGGAVAPEPEPFERAAAFVRARASASSSPSDSSSIAPKSSRSGMAS